VARTPGYGSMKSLPTAAALFAIPLLLACSSTPALQVTPAPLLTATLRGTPAPPPAGTLRRAPTSSATPDCPLNVADDPPWVCRKGTNTPSPSLTPAPPSSTPCQIPSALREQVAESVFLALFPNTPGILISYYPAVLGDELHFFADFFSDSQGYGRAFLSKISRATSDDFLASNLHPRPPAELNLPFEHALLPESYLNDLFADDLDLGWQRFYLEFPNSEGFWTFSEVGLNCESSQALVYVVHVFGTLGMTGTLYLLNANAGVWFIVSQFLYSEA